MNIITDCLPSWIEISGRRLNIRTDFRIWMEFDRMMHLRDAPSREKFIMICRLCIEDDILGDISPDEIMDGLCSFYLCGAKPNPKGADKAQPVFSFSQDSGYVFAAFLSRYGIDLLSNPYMHWFVFSALLKGLDDSCRLMKIMSWRGVEPEKENNPKRKKILRQMKEMYARPCSSRPSSTSRRFS